MSMRVEVDGRPLLKPIWRLVPLVGGRPFGDLL
jgi:hypothetical protein